MRKLTPLLLALVGTLAAQSPYEHLLLRTYGLSEGLPSLNVTSIAHDSAGVVWVATDRGLVGSTDEGFAIDRGLLYTYFQRGTTRMTRSRHRNGFVIVSRGGDAFEVNFGVLYRTDGYTPRIIFPEWSADSARTIPFTAVTVTLNEEIVLGTAKKGIWMRGLPEGTSPRESWAFRGLPIRHIPFSGDVTALTCDSSGTVWVGSNRGLFRIDGERCVPFELGPLRSAMITALTAISDGSVIVGTERGGYVVNGNNVGRLAAAGNASISAIVEAADSTLWIGTSSIGVVRIRGALASVYGTEKGLPSNTVQAIDADPSGNVWVGTDRGVTKIAPQVYHEYVAGRDIPDGSWGSGLLARDGSRWFGGQGVLLRFAGFEPRVIRAPASMQDLMFRQLLEAADGSIWILTGEGLVHFDGRAFRLFRDDSATSGDHLQLAVMAYHDRVGPAILWRKVIRRLERDTFRTVYVNSGIRPLHDCAYDRDGNLWFVSWESCGRIAPDGRVTMIPAIRNSIRLRTFSDGSIGVVDGTYGLVLQQELESLRGDSIPPSWQRKSGLPLFTSFEDGFLASNGRRFGVIAFTSIREQSGPGQNFGPLAAEHYGLSEVVTTRADGRILLNVNRGTLRRLMTFDPDDGRIIPEPLLDDLLSSYKRVDDEVPYGGAAATHWMKAFEDRTATLWWASSLGIMAIPPTRQTGSLGPPAIVSVTAGESRFLPGLISSGDAITNSLPWWKDETRGHLAGFSPGFRFTIPSEDNDVQIAAAFHTPPPRAGLQFQGKLEGRDSSWSEPTDRTTFSYRDLAQGRYTFRIRAVAPSGEMSPERAIVLTLITPFWRATWFLTVLAVTVAYVTLRITTIRFRRLKDEHVRSTKQAVQENELRMARAVQMGMLPEHAPELAGFEIAARSMPAAEVGGDFYDFIQDGGRTGIAVGDVSGHGITGAMIVGMARTSLRFASSRFERPSRVLTLANDRLRRDISRSAFIAMFYGLLDPKKHTLQYICAGQPTPVLIRGGKADFLPRGRGDRFPLGIMPRVSYREERLSLRPGDVLVIYTDGFVEAMNGSREEFGFDRFLRTLEAHATRSAADLIAATTADVQAHAAGALQEDDMTMVVLRVRKGVRS